MSIWPYHATLCKLNAHFHLGFYCYYAQFSHVLFILSSLPRDFIENFKPSVTESSNSFTKLLTG